MARCRAGDSLAELATTLERSEGAVVLRAKRLLPLEERGSPEDRVVPHLHALLTEDADYDWEHHLAATPPPRPIINHLPAPQVRKGIAGLFDEQLLAVAGLAIRLGVDPLVQDLRHELSREIESRGLGHQLADYVSRDSAAWLEDFRRESRYLAYPGDWWAEPELPTYPEPPPYDDHEAPDERSW